MKRLKTEHIDQFVAHTMANLPDSLKARKTVLVTLHTLLPRDYERTDEIGQMIQSLNHQEALQVKFTNLFKA